MRMVLAVVGQFGLFLLTFLVGSLLVHPFGLRTTLAGDAGHMRVFVWDGLLLMLGLYVVALGLELAMKWKRAVGWTTLAVGLAGAAGLLMKFGFLVTDR